MTIPGFKTGDRVRFSEKGKRAYPRSKDRIGTITNDPQSKTRHYHRYFLMVQWDGNICPTEYNPAFIEHAIDWPVLCAEVQATFMERLAYLGEIE